MEKFILSFDQGTTSSRAIVFNAQGDMMGLGQKEFEQIYPAPGWVEHDALEIWSTQLGVAAEAVSKAGISTQQIAAIGITNQRETTVVWNKKTGQPIYNAIVWQDKRTATLCNSLKQQGYTQLIQEKTGLVIDAYFSATKLAWILDNVPNAREMAANNELCFGTIDTWLVWKLTNGKVHVTDVSNASRTMLFNIHTLSWDDELLTLFNIPKSVLPTVASSSEVYGHTQQILTAHEIPIAGIAGDQQAALFGQLCSKPGMVKNTYGTGCFMLMNTGEKAIISRHQLLTTVAWKIGNQVQYALEGSVFIAGAVVQWLRDGLQIIRSSSEVELLAKQVVDTDGVYMVPAFAGLGSPYWNQEARGAITGITRGTTQAHIALASIQSIAFQAADVVRAMEADAGITIAELRVDGGATENNLLMQFQANLLQTNIIKPTITETTALGAAFLAGLAVGYWPNMAALQSIWQQQQVFTPQASPADMQPLQDGWARAIRSVQTT
ncbi:MAG: glycerol kinase [Bacteroidetes bacterium]|nr:MAG: glycerol kinase [Bacteroidota bacterium]